MLGTAGSGPFIKIKVLKSHLQSCFSFYVITEFLVISSRVESIWFLQSLIKPAVQRQVPDMLLSQRFLSLDRLIMTSLQNSILKISRHCVFVKFFKNSKLLKYPGAALVSFAKSYHSYPCKKYQRKSLFQPNLRRKPKSQKSINPEKVSKAKHYKVGDGKSKNQIGVFIKVFQ